MSNEMFRMEGITKIYPNGFVANKNISFEVNEGEIHGLVGENGAGKTTLMKILFGMEDAQEGSIYIKGQKAKLKNPLDAIAHGVGMVHQHFMLLDSLTVAENVVLGIEPMKNGLFDFEGAKKMTQEISDRYKFNLNANDRVKDLSVGQMQKVEILRALIKGAKVLILDEPTAVLTSQETIELFEQLAGLREKGHAIIFISHKLEEVMRLCGRVTVLRHGYSQGTYDASELTEAKLSRLMVGRDVILKMNKTAPRKGMKVVEIERLAHAAKTGQAIIDGVSFSIHEGEIVGIAGVEGNGQSELTEAITGMLPYSDGVVKINGRDIKGKSIREIREIGLAHIPEDRMALGCAANLSIRDNIIADRFRRKGFMSGFFMNWKYADKIVDECIDQFEILCEDRYQPVRMLSGGNIQKVVVAREFSAGAKVIIANQPTRGIDVGTAEMIRKTLLKKARDENIGALLVSADLNELLEVSDRLLVMRKGKIVAAFPQANVVREEELGEYMLGIRAMTQSEMAGAI
jgi:simple sugar transport system ATP-binding protein